MVIDLLAEYTTSESACDKRVLRAKSALASQVGRFPMDVDVTEVRRFIQQKKSSRNKDKASIIRAYNDSSHLQQYGKCLFEYVLSKKECPTTQPGHNFTSRTGRQMVQSHTSGRSSSDRLSTSSGPTRHGSLLYNKKALVLSQIRTRPASVPTSSFVHQKSTLFPDLSKSVNPCGYRFKVTTPTLGVFKRQNGYEKFTNFDEMVLLTDDISTFGDLLVGSLQKEETQSDEEIVEVPKSCYRKPSIPILLQIDAPESSESESLEKIAENQLSDCRPSSGRELLSPKAKGNNTRTGKKSASGMKDVSRPGKSTDNQRTSSPTTEGLRPNSANRGRAKGQGSGTTRDRRQSPGNRQGLKGVKEESPSRLPLPGPHCWVDDLTVSSEQTVGEDGKSITNSNMDEKCDTVGVAAVTSDKYFREDQLPDFLCPSSELKSRKAATKRWLNKTPFVKAIRSIPLL